MPSFRPDAFRWLRQNAGMDEDAFTAIPATGYRRTRWRNGRGWTRAILALPDEADWDLRLSIAEVDAVADFSPFPGVEREQVLLHTQICEFVAYHI